MSGTAPGGGLRSGAVGTAASTVLSLASTAPAYSLAVSVGLLVSLVGGWTPLLLLVSAVPILLVVLCFRELNAERPDCGTCFTWASRALGPRTGWLTGWLSIAACVLVMSNLLQVAAVYLLTVLGADAAADSRAAQGAVGVTLLVAVAWLAHRGITVAARTQLVLLGLEVAALGWFAAAALAAGPLPAADAPVPAPGSSDVVAAFLVAVFLYWGWDSSFSVNEESVDPHRTPARAALGALAVLALAYAAFAAVVLAHAGPARLSRIGEDDLLAALGASLMGSTGGTVLAGAVLLSALASSQTTILPAARSAYAMARVGLAPRPLATVSATGSPAGATWTVTAVSGAVYVALVATSDAVLADSVAATAVLVAAYYTLTALAVPIGHGRRGIARRPLARLVVPVSAAGLLGYVLVASLADLATTSLVAVGVVLATGALCVVGLPRDRSSPGPAAPRADTATVPSHQPTRETR